MSDALPFLTMLNLIFTAAVYGTVLSMRRARRRTASTINALDLNLIRKLSRLLEEEAQRRNR